MYGLRRKLQDDDNPAEVVIKLLMNSMYGKTIIKPVEIDTIVKDSRGYFGEYISLNVNYIDSVLEVNGRYDIKQVKSVMSHFNYCLCGVEIVSVSKRIMNKVFSCADDHSIKIYYQDTDSIYLNYNDAAEVVNKCEEKYNQDLVGKYSGNFLIDFKMVDARKNAEMYSIESLLLGKKTYIDSL